MYLVDTNVWLERLLDQERSAEVGRFLSEVVSEQLLMTDFSLHSIGIILCRLGRGAALLQFADDLFVEGGVKLATVGPKLMHRVLDTMSQAGLDFDDAYQYVAAEQAGAVIVSYDRDFDRTVRKRQTPGEILSEGATEQ
jgi:predicted nucleic acid-binding protein